MSDFDEPLIDSHCHAWPVWPYERKVDEPDASLRALTTIHALNRVEAGLVVCANLPEATHSRAKSNNEWVVSLAAPMARLRVAIDVDSKWSSTYHSPDAVGRLRRLASELKPHAVTHYLANTDDGWLNSSEGLRFFAEIARLGLPLSLHAPDCWSDSLDRLGHTLPGLTVVLHHFGLPRDAEGLSAMMLLARHPNFYVKVSGVNYIDGISVGRLLSSVYDAFGPGRMLWGSDWPASNGVVPFLGVAEAVRDSAFVSNREQALILGETARTVFFERKVNGDAG